MSFGEGNEYALAAMAMSTAIERIYRHLQVILPHTMYDKHKHTHHLRSINQLSMDVTNWTSLFVHEKSDFYIIIMIIVYLL